MGNTEVVEKSLDPVWNYEAKFQAKKGGVPANLELQLLDQDKGMLYNSKKSMGKVCMCVCECQHLLQQYQHPPTQTIDKLTNAHVCFGKVSLELAEYANACFECSFPVQHQVVRQEAE